MSTNQLKRISSSVAAILLLLVSCEKIPSYHEDGSNITAAEAVEIVRPLLHQYGEECRAWFIGKDPIPARTTIKYGPFGKYDPKSKYCGTFKSPGYKAWLVFVGPDQRYNGPHTGGTCLFVNVRTGKYEAIDIDGQVAGIEWDRSFCVITE